MIFLYKAGSFIFATSVKSESVKKEQLQSWFGLASRFRLGTRSTQNFRAGSFCCSSIYFVQQDHAFKALLVPNELREFVKILFT